MLALNSSQNEHCAQPETGAASAQDTVPNIAERIRCGAQALSFITDSEYFDDEPLSADAMLIAAEIEHQSEALSVEQDPAETASEILRLIGELRVIASDDRPTPWPATPSNSSPTPWNAKRGRCRLPRDAAFSPRTCVAHSVQLLRDHRESCIELLNNWGTDMLKEDAGAPITKRDLEIAMAVRFERGEGYAAHVRRRLQASGVMISSARGRHSRPENALGILGLGIGILHDAPLNDVAQLVRDTLDAPITHHLLLRRSGGWESEREENDRVNDACREMPFGLAFEELTSLLPEAPHTLGSVLCAVIEAIADGQIEPNSDLSFDIELVWRRPAANIKIRRRVRGQSPKLLLCAFGDAEHRPGQGCIRINFADLTFFGDMLRRGA